MLRQRIRDKTELKYKIIIKTLLASYSLEKFSMTNDPVQLARIYGEIRI